MSCDHQVILFAPNSQEAADRAKMMLSWDVLNGVSAPQVLTWTNLVPRLLCGGERGCTWTCLLKYDVYVPNKDASLA